MKNHPEKVYPSVAVMTGAVLFGAMVASQAGGKVTVWGGNDHGQRQLPNGTHG